MKKISFCVLLAMMLFLFAACAGTDIPAGGDDNQQTGTVRLSEHVLVLEEGESATLTAVAEPQGDIGWSTDNAAVAAVTESGSVQGLQAGYAVITAKSGSAADYCEVYVSAKAEADGDAQTEKYQANFAGSDAVPSDLAVTTEGDASVTAGRDGLNIAVNAAGASAYVKKQFAAPLAGRVYVEMRAKVGSSAFSNLMYFYRGTQGDDPNADGVLTFAMSGGVFQYHDGSGWKSTGVRYVTDAWYDVSIMFDCGIGMFNVTVNGVEYCGFPFRNGGAGYEDAIGMIVFGASQSGADMTYEFIRVTQKIEGYAPEIYTAQTAYSADLQEEIVLDYTVTGDPAPAVSVVCPQGITVAEDSKTITASAEGVYTVTIRAENSQGVAEKTFTLNVLGQSSVYWDTDFESAAAAGVTVSGSGGNVSFGDGVTISSQNTSGIWMDKKFDRAFDGIVVTEVTFRENVENITSAFANLLFFYTSTASGGLGSNAMAVAVRNGYNALVWSETKSGGWTDFTDPNGGRADLKINTEYTLKVVNDFDNKVSYFYLTGEGVNYVFSETYLGSHAFRDTSLENIDRIRIGSDKTGTDFTLTRLRVYQGSQADILSQQ